MNLNRNQRRRRLIRNYPAHDIEESLGIARVIYEQNAGLPLQRTLLATGLGTTVNSSSFVTKLAASEEYGITQGRYRSESIKITELGMSIVAKRTQHEFHEALSASMLKPTLFHKLNGLLQGKPLPGKEFLTNLLIRDLGLHPDQTEEFTKIYTANSLFASPTAASVESKVGIVKEEFHLGNQISTDLGDQDQHHVEKRNLKEKQIGVLCRRENRHTAIYLSDFLKRLKLSTVIIELEDINKAGPPTLPFVATLVIVQPIEPNDYHAYGYLLGYGTGISNGNMMIISTKNFDQTQAPYSYTNCKKIIEDNLPNIGMRVIEELNNSGILSIQFNH